ncbi:MAG: coenzyme F420-0:L-glutamate ligase [Chloroflexota bacterium]
MISLVPARGLPLIEPGAALADLIVAALEADGFQLAPGDVLVIAQKIVSKSEGRIARIDDVAPSPRAIELGLLTDKDPRLVELILSESSEVLRARAGVLIVEDRRGFVCANAGVDRSNVQQRGGGEDVALLPVDPDASARFICNRLSTLTGARIPIIINDSHGRAWREGTVGVAIGVAGMSALWDRRGDVDLTGYALQNTVIGLADELAAAASLLMGPASEGVPAVAIRGATFPDGAGSAQQLRRPHGRDLFR